MRLGMQGGFCDRPAAFDCSSLVVRIHSPSKIRLFTTTGLLSTDAASKTISQTRSELNKLASDVNRNASICSPNVVCLCGECRPAVCSEVPSHVRSALALWRAWLQLGLSNRDQDPFHDVPRTCHDAPPAATRTEARFSSKHQVCHPDFSHGPKARTLVHQRAHEHSYSPPSRKDCDSGKHLSRCDFDCSLSPRAIVAHLEARRRPSLGSVGFRARLWEEFRRNPAAMAKFGHEAPITKPKHR